ncbi:MAG: thrombospondin type 3 repeat-containing protein [Gammaproteobacteria bacterium]|nr:thrombospondin type 3 repeat-containing protein [Gammaproteobacteria bacterium]
MKKQGREILAASVAAALGGVAGQAHAATYTATLQQVLTYGNNGTAGLAGNVTSSTASWAYDSVTNLVTQTGGTFNLRQTTAPTSTLYRTSITGLVIGNGAPASATTYVCTEGNFGANVGASICGNYSFGNNFENASTTSWGPGTAVSRTLGDDDVALGDPQSIVLLDGMVTQTFDGNTLVITNRTCTGVCTTLPAGAYNGGQQWTFGSLVNVFPDTTPDPFSFEDQAGVALATLTTSQPVTITGLDSAAPITVTDGEYSQNGGPFTAAAGTVTPNSSVRVRHVSSGAPDTAVDTVLTVGGVSDTFTSTTVRYAVDDAVVAAINLPREIDVLANDTGLAATVAVGIWSGPAHGTATVDGSPGTPGGIRITYTPTPGYFGPDAFEYWVETNSVIDYGLVTVDVSNADADGDGVVDVVDNCTLLPNPGQCDSDGDGFGNRCDGDLTNNGATNAQDTVVFRNRLGKPSTAPTYNAADLNCSGAVNAQDTVLFRLLLGSPPGPAGQQ